jgi:hypothetical protein
MGRLPPLAGVLEDAGVAVREAELQAAVIECARLFNWRVAHFRPARTKYGWRTAMTGDPGWPDLSLAREGRLVFLELKQKGKRPTVEQAGWLAVLGSVPGVEARVVTSTDWESGLVERLLR